jgi:hypothetical protein
MPNSALGVYHVAEHGEYIFEIDVFTPLTLSMKRLNEYIGDLINLFANEDSVHFLRVEEGSASPTMFVDAPAVVRVERRILAVKTGGASVRAKRAFDGLNNKLAEDNAVARLYSRQGDLLYFPGRELGTSPEIGPIREPGTLEGEVIGVAGRDETIQIYLREGERIHTCTGSKEKARALALHLFEGKVRVFGEGKWKRTKSGEWELSSFFVDSFVPLKTEPHTEVVKDLRSIESAELARIKSPMSYLEELRQEAGESHK